MTVIDQEVAVVCGLWPGEEIVSVMELVVMDIRVKSQPFVNATNKCPKYCEFYYLL